MSRTFASRTFAARTWHARTWHGLGVIAPVEQPPCPYRPGRVDEALAPFARSPLVVAAPARTELSVTPASRAVESPLVARKRVSAEPLDRRQRPYQCR